MPSPNRTEVDCRRVHPSGRNLSLGRQIWNRRSAVRTERILSKVWSVVGSCIGRLLLCEAVDRAQAPHEIDRVDAHH